ncbi:unnamed protein product [Parajaminaea phylloscopi]
MPSPTPYRPRSLLLPLLLLLLLLLAMTATLATADHQGCETGAKTKDYSLWCTAKADKKGVFACHGNFPGSDAGSHPVAALVNPHTLNFTTPCNIGGYAYVHELGVVLCAAKAWLVGNVDGDGQLYALSFRDDCTLLRYFKKPPQSVDIYFNRIH